MAFDAQAILGEGASGMADRRSGRLVTTGDPVRVASISKLIVAIGVMRLVEGGQLELDRDVSDYIGWSLRNPAFPDVPITLRQLLAHTSSLRDGAGYVVPLGDRVQSRVGEPQAWDAEHPPGRFFSYTNLNTPIVASVMEQVTGERFDLLMERLVFAPLELDACFGWTTCSDAAIARHVVLHDVTGPVRWDDLGGLRPACPVPTDEAATDCDLSAYRPGDNGALFSPQGGLRISMRDLARIGQLLLNEGEGLLSRQSVAMLLHPVWVFDGSNGETMGGIFCSYGLASEGLATPVEGCRDDLFGDGRPRVGHAGEAYGLRSGLWIDRAAGTGVAFFATAIPDTAADGATSAFARIEERLARGD